MTDFVYDLDPAHPCDFGPTPSQTVGPYLHIGLAWDDGADVVPGRTPDLLTIRGTVYDGAGQPITDAMVETWQADARGRVAHPDVRGIPRFRPRRHRRWRVRDADREARTGRSAAGAAYRRFGLRAGNAGSLRHTDLLSGRASRERRRPVTVTGARGATSDSRSTRCARPLAVRHSPAGKRRDGLL